MMHSWVSHLLFFSNFIYLILYQNRFKPAEEGYYMKKKIYAVRKGRNPGIYDVWAETEQQVKGFSGAE